MYFVRIRDVLPTNTPGPRRRWARRRFTTGDRLPRRLPAGPIRRCVRSAGGCRRFSPRTRRPCARPWLADLARLERARLELVDSADAETLTLETLRAFPPERFAAFRLRIIPSHALIETRIDVVPLWRADDPRRPVQSRTPTSLIVWRQDSDVFHRAADAEETAGSAGSTRARSRSASCARGWRPIAPTRRPPRAPSSYCGRWASDALLRADCDR